MPHKSKRSNYKSRPGHKLPSQAAAKAKARSFGQRGKAKRKKG